MLIKCLEVVLQKKNEIKKIKMAAKFSINGYFFGPVCSLCLKINFISLSILCFSNFLYLILFLLLFKIIFITFGCGFDKLISLVEKIRFPGTLRIIPLISVSSLEKKHRKRLAMLTSWNMAHVPFLCKFVPPLTKNVYWVIARSISQIIHWSF